MPCDVLRRHHLGDLSIGGALDVVRAHVGKRVLEQRDRRVVAVLGVVDHDVADREPVVRPRREVVVAVVARVLRVLLVGRRYDAAREPVRALGVREPRIAEVLGAGENRGLRVDFPRRRRSGRRGGSCQDERSRKR